MCGEGRGGGGEPLGKGVWLFCLDLFSFEDTDTMRSLARREHARLVPRSEGRRELSNDFLWVVCG